MENIQDNPESQEKALITYVIDCRRHAKNQDVKEISDFESSLTEKGIEKSEDLAISRPSVSTGDSYVSEFPRTRQTVESIRQGEWGMPEDAEPEKINETARLRGKDIYSNHEFRKKYFTVAHEKGHASAAQWFLNHKDQRPEDAPISPKEMAAGYASVINDLVLELKGKEPAQKTEIIPKTIVSHDLNMEAFLFYTIGEQSENFMEQIGQISKLDGFKIILDKKGNEIIGKLKFKDILYVLDLDKLQELANKYFSSK